MNTKQLRVVFVFVAVAGCHRETSAPVGETFDAGAFVGDSLSTLSHSFQLKNNTSRNVSILDESHSCTCTKIAYIKGVLKPGQETTLGMSLTLPQGYSKQQVSCIVKTDDPKYPDWYYHLRFVHFPRWRIEPREIDFGAYEENNPGSKIPVKAATRTANLDVEYYKFAGEPQPSTPWGCDLGLMYYEPPESRHRPTFGMRSDCKPCL